MEKVHVGGNKYIDKQMYAVLKTVSAMVGFDVIALITQGSWNSSVKASGPTHRGAGAVDVMGTEAQLIKIVSAFRRVATGYGTGWVRYPNGKWNLHAHLILVVDGCDPSIAAQYKAYLRGENGLGGGKDNGPRDWVKPTGETIPLLGNSDKAQEFIDAWDPTKKLVKTEQQGPLESIGELVAELGSPEFQRRALFIALGLGILVLAIVRLTGVSSRIDLSAIKGK